MAIDSTVQLKIWNKALLIAGERRLTSITEDREPMRLLTVAWQTVPQACLEEADWGFALRKIRLDYDPSYEPDWGYKYLFTKPVDWVRTAALCTDQYFRNALLDYDDESGFWATDWDQIFVKYVSNDDSYGMNAGNWPVSFMNYLSAALAMEIAPKLTNNSDADVVAKKYEFYRNIAMNKDALRQPTKILPAGHLVRARWGDRSYRR